MGTMKPPVCKLCKSPHWLDEEHKITETVPEYVRAMAKGAMESVPPVPVETIPVRVRATVVDYVPTPPPDVPTEVSLQESCVCGKPREGRYKSCAACRKRAYRERSK